MLSHFGRVQPLLQILSSCGHGALAVLGLGRGRPAAFAGIWTFAMLAGASLDQIGADSRGNCLKTSGPLGNWQAVALAARAPIVLSQWFASGIHGLCGSP